MIHWPFNSCDQVPLVIVDSKDTVLGVEIIVTLVKLVEVYDGGGQSHGEVRPLEREVITNLALEQHDIGSFDCDILAITKFDGAMDHCWLTYGWLLCYQGTSGCCSALSHHRGVRIPSPQ